MTTPATPRPAQAPPARQARPAGDLTFRVGVAVFAVGLVAAVAAVLPLFLGDAPLPLPFYLLAMLAPVGLGLVLLGAWQAARARSRRTRSAGAREGR